MSDHMERAVRAAREKPTNGAKCYGCIVCESCMELMLRAALPHLVEAVLEEWDRTPKLVYKGESYNDCVRREMRDVTRRIAEDA